MTSRGMRVRWALPVSATSFLPLEDDEHEHEHDRDDEVRVVGHPPVLGTEAPGDHGVERAAEADEHRAQAEEQAARVALEVVGDHGADGVLHAAHGETDGDGGEERRVELSWNATGSRPTR